MGWDFNDIVEARYIRDFRPFVRFDDGLAGEIDLSSYTGRGVVFQPLADQSFFKRVRISGGTLAWPNGADIAPETLYAKLEALPKATASK